MALSKISLDKDNKEKLESYLKAEGAPDLVAAYLYWLEQAFQVHAVLYPPDKKIYRDVDTVVQRLEKAGRLWRETSIKVGRYKEDVNEDTRRIYICPFTGKVFGDNTHPNPQDAIYDWVSTCPENTERSGGLRVKRFYVSEDPKVIQEYIDKSEDRRPVTKTVYSSVLSGRLFNSKEAVIEDFKANAVKRLSLLEVQTQSRFEIESDFLEFLQDHLQEERITEFVEVLAEHEEFVPFVQQWIVADEEEDAGDVEQ